MKRGARLQLQPLTLPNKLRRCHPPLYMSLSATQHCLWPTGLGPHPPTAASCRHMCTEQRKTALMDWDHFALRPQKRGGLLGTGTSGGGGGGGGGPKSEGSTADTARRRPERPWTAARTMEVLRRCPLAIAQRLVHRAVAVSTAVLGQSHKDNVRCTAVEEQPEAKEVQIS